MKRFMLLIIWALMFSGLKAQEPLEMRIVEGVMYDDFGEAIPGVNILIKNSSTGTVTNMEGYYQIIAPLGSVLVFSSVGFTPHEIVVTRNNSRSLDGIEKEPKVENKQITVPNKLLDIFSLDQQQGVAVMHDSLPRAVRKFKSPYMRAYKIKYIPPALASIKFGKKGSNGSYVLSLPFRKGSTSQLSYQTVFEVRQASRFPKLQNELAQGRADNGALTWRGPHQQEIYSWGPLVSSLEYDGSAYPYHPQGQLVPVGDGNGIAADNYNPLDFFQNGIYWKNNLGFVLDKYNLNISGNIGQDALKDITPHKGNENFYGDLFFKHHSYLGSIKLKAAANQQNQWGPQGFNQIKTIGAVYRTPPTFNNENNFQLPDNSPISHAPSVIDNPYGLTINIPDQRKTQNASIGLGGDFDIDSYGSSLFELSINGQYNYTFDDFQMGLHPYSPMLENGWLTEREYENNHFSTDISLTSNPIGYDVTVIFKLRHQYLASDSRLYRNDGLDFENDYRIDQASIQILDTFQLMREVHQVKLGTDFEFRNLMKLSLNQQVYISNTVPDKQIYWLPSIISKFLLDDIINDIFSVSGYWGDLSINAAFSKNVNEAPLIYNRWHFQGLDFPVADYNQVFERNEIFFQNGFQPEIIDKFDVGLEYNIDGFSADFEYFYNKTKHLLVPVRSGTNVNLANMATVVNPGYNISLQYIIGNYNTQFSYLPKINFQRNRPVVRSSNQSIIPIAGFENAFTAISEGLPLGAIYGTTYQRNPDGEIIIGDDGFPLKNEVPAYLGNPNPDFILNFSNQFKIASFKIDWVLEWRQGGSIWNGTQAHLDYLGRSQATADLRNTSSYLFQGVKADNSVNTQVIDFYDPSLPLIENRWVRYGADGIGEDYVSEVSWLRLSKLLIGYEISYPANSLIDQLFLNVYANNLFFKSNYEGIAPINPWNDDITGQGLDFFNYPMLRTFGFSMTLKF